MEAAKKNCFAAEVLEEQTFKDVPEEIDCPVEVEHIWQWFQKLDKLRHNAGMGHGPIGCLEIEAWARLKKLDISSFEVDALLEVDAAFLIHSYSKSQK